LGGNRTTDILESPDLVNFTASLLTTVQLQKKLKLEASDDDDVEMDEGDEAE
jgi:hypothetical protein